MTDQLHVRVVMISGADHTIDLGTISALSPSDDLVEVLSNLRALTVVKTTRGAVLDPQRIESVEVDPTWRQEQVSESYVQHLLRQLRVEVARRALPPPLLRVVSDRGVETEWYGESPRHTAEGHRLDARHADGRRAQAVCLLLAAARERLETTKRETWPTSYTYDELLGA